MTALRESGAFRTLERHHQEVAGLRLADLFSGDPSRGSDLALEACGLYFDYSKNLITRDTVGLLAELAGEMRMPERRDAMFNGECVNTSEGRPALHTALRMPRNRSLVLDGVDVVREVHEVLDRMAAFCERVRSGDWKGHSGRPIRRIINIGIGGSDLGPVMAFEALKHYSRRDLEFRFISNVDGTDFHEANCGRVQSP